MSVLDSLKTTNEFKDNITMLSVTTNIGKLYFKKIHNINCSLILHNSIGNGYNILARMMGFTHLVNDQHFKYGVILEQCWPVKEMNLQMIKKGLIALRRLHIANMGMIHGDCNPDNIMVDKFNNLKLVDPVNLINRQIIFRNASYYESDQPDEELRVFCYSCFEIYAKLSGCDINDVKIRKTESGDLDISIKEGILVKSILSDIVFTIEDMSSCILFNPSTLFSLFGGDKYINDVDDEINDIISNLSVVNLNDSDSDS